jgi:predicted ATP-dependent protease
MRRVLTQTAQAEPPPSDYCYVYNFTDPYRPRALELPAGRGRELRDEMARFVEEVKLRLPRAFEGEEFERQKSEILEEFHRRQHAEMERLEEAARADGFAILRTPSGLAVAPAPCGTPLTPEKYEALTEKAKKEIEARGGALEERLEATLRQLRQFEREARQAHEKLVSQVAAAATRQLIQELRERFAGIAAIGEYLDQVERHLIAHAEEFRQLEEGKAQLPFLPPPGAFLDRYRVNALVDRSGARGAPVVLEQNPTHGNLLGRFEHRVHFGNLVTDFTLIKAGALHQANGGYLILEARDLLQTFLAWEALKKA